MKYSIIFATAVFALFGCGDSAAPVGSGDNTASQNERQLEGETVIAHSTDRSGKNPADNSAGGGGKSGWSRGGDPIDTASFDAEIASAKKALDASPNSDSAKKTLSEAYTKRGVALTQARQYAAALGDYRKAVKLDPSNQTAKTWIDQIIVIYSGMNKEYPKEGEEPEPLPYKGEGV
ncbi:MAG TPA: tetratricopeptide repeat protein [Aridibacter sp.]|nr:tetratricopeptide repeat protein [Aridibacter sp.]